MRAAAVVLALALGAECFAPAPTARTSTALNAAGHAVIVRLRRRKSSSCCLAAVDAVRGVSVSYTHLTLPTILLV